MDEEFKTMSRKELVEKAKEKGVIYNGVMNKEQLCRVLSLNKKDPYIICLPEVEKKWEEYREQHRERACQTSKIWRQNNPEKGKEHMERYIQRYY